MLLLNSLSSIPVQEVGYLQRTGYCFQFRHKASARESVITHWEKKVRWKLASYHLHIMKYLAYLHILSSPSSPSMETRGIPLASKFYSCLFKQRPVTLGFSPIFVYFYYSCLLPIFVSSYFVRENLFWCYANCLLFFHLVTQLEVKET